LLVSDRDAWKIRAAVLARSSRCAARYHLSARLQDTYVPNEMLLGEVELMGPACAPSVLRGYVHTAVLGPLGVEPGL
jgi:hypothetical protein